MTVIFDTVLEGGAGTALVVEPGQRLRVTDLEGRQVVDMAVFNADNPREKLSLPYSRSRYTPEPGQAFHPGDRLLAGDVLRSTIYAPMMRIVEETPEPKGVHGVDGRMCNRHLYAAYGDPGKDGCQEILARALAPHGLKPEDIPDCFDIFMSYRHDCADGRWVIADGVSRPGDHITFEAQMRCLVALSNCPYFRGTPMKVEMFEAAG